MIQAQRELATILGDQLPTGWRDAYEAVPRHLFLPPQAWRMNDETGEITEIDRDADEQAWMGAAYSPDIIVTQRYEGGRPSSSCSMPMMVFKMLEHLDVQDGQKVLEIGTGTGWNAALLAAQVGDAGVTSIEVDAVIAAQARENLRLAGRSPLVVTADGALGYLDAAPFDRIEATCSVHEVPYAWIGQTRPGGIIVTPWGNTLSNTGLLKLTVHNDGSAHGRFVGYSAFMWLRAQKPGFPDEPDQFAEQAGISRTSADLDEVFSDGALFAAGMLVPGCGEAWETGSDGSKTVRWLLGADSWASIDAADGTVRQLGPRKLWDEVESAYGWWTDQGRPEVYRFGLSVTPAGQRYWLDDPQQVIG